MKSAFKAGDTLATSAGRDVNLNALTDVTTTSEHHREGRTSVSTSRLDETLRGTTLDATHGIVISAGRDITATAANLASSDGAIALGAGHDITLDAGVENHGTTRDTRYKKSGLFSSKTTKGKAHGNGSTHTDTVVSAADTLRLVAGHDATIQGAQAQGRTVLADVGHDLTITSEQDTGDYASTQWQVGGKVVVGMGASASGSASYGKVDSHYASVTQASGIQAGDGGYRVRVGDTTHLVGGQLASTADPGLNLLDTGNLAAESVHNVSKYDAISVSVSGGSGAMAGGGGGLSKQSHDARSDTQSGIAAGTLRVRNGPVQGELDRNQTALEANGVKDGFDARKVAERQELGEVAGYVGMRAVGDLAKYEHDQAQADWLAAPQGSDAEADAKARLAQWSDGGTYKTILHGVVGAGIAALGGGDAAKGALGAAASEKASAVMQDYLIEHGYDPNKGTGKVLMELASTAIGGAAGGGAGAAAALNGELYNRQLHDWEHKLAKELAAKSNGEYTWQEIEDAMRNSSYGSPNAPAVDFGMGDNVGNGELYAYTPPGTAEVIMSWSAFSQQGGTLDPGSSFTFPTSQNPGLYGYGSDVMAVQSMPALDRGAADFIAAHMTDADIQKSYGSQFNSDYGTWQYTWQPEPKPYTPTVLGYEPQQQGVRGNNATFYDRMLGRVVTIGVSGVCATAECAMKGGNFDMDDPRTQQYLSDVGHAQLKFGATVASVAVGGAWVALAKEAMIPSWMAYSGAGATSAGANATAQYLTTGTVRAPDVIFAGVTGTYGGWATRLPGWQAPVSMMIVNTGGAAANTMVDNAVYGDNKNVVTSIFTSGLGTAFGYKSAEYMSGGFTNPWVINSTSAIFSESVTRSADSMIEKIKSDNESKREGGKD